MGRRTMLIGDEQSYELDKELTSDESAVVEEIVCKADELPDGTKKEVEVRGRKILIINDGGKYMAVNGLCSHFNYPLVTGQYYKGRIRCPLHGACFNTDTGDIEDYPAYDHLHAFQVVKVGDDLVITTTEKRLESDRRTIKSRLKKTTVEKPIIVVGSGPAGQSVLENLRLAGCNQPIVQFTKEAMPAYDRVILNKRLTMDAVRLRPDEFYTENHISVMLNSEVVGFNAADHTVTLSDGSIHFYDKLVLALGGRVRTLNVEGGDLKRVFTMRNHDDPAKIVEAAKGRDIVCVGASFIGCSDGYDEIFTRGDVDNLDFVKYYLKNNRVIAVSSGGHSGAAIQFLALCELHKKISREDIEKNTSDDWTFMLK